MPNDNRPSNFEKEPTPERKWWSVFERQSEFEQPEQNETLKERAKDLKSAAKERGHFWETFMPSREKPEDQENIAPKGEKVRKKWRALLKRKSEKQIEEFEQTNPETIDSYWLAQLMVAERIMTLHNLLAESEPKTDTRRQIKTELDVMGLLSEKLSDPEINVPEEIEQTYQTTVEVLAGGDDNLKLEEIPEIKEINNDTEKPDTQEESRRQSFQRYGAAVIVAIKLAVNKPEALKPQKVQPPGAFSGLTTTPPTSPVRPSAPQTMPHPHITPNVAPGLALTAAVIIAEYSDRQEQPKHDQLAPPETFTTNQTTITPETVATPSPGVELQRTAPQEISPMQSESSAPLPEVIIPTSTRKLEHMKTEQLLALARTISLGNGEYLEQAYRQGKIDRDGLIKVLKTAARRGNYRYEYKRISGEYLRMKSQSTFVAPDVVSETESEVGDTRSDSSTTQTTDTNKTVRISRRNESYQQRFTRQMQPILSVKAVTFICVIIIAVTIVVLSLR